MDVLTTLPAKRPAEGSPRPARRLGRPPALPADEERRQMVDAAFRVLSIRPAGPVRVSEILAEAGLSTRSFYRHFKAKGDLLLAVFESESERASAELVRTMANASSPRNALERWIEFYLALSFEPRRHQRMFVMHSPEVVQAPGYAAAQARIQASHRVLLVEALRAGSVDGSFPHVRPESDAVCIQDLVSSVVMRHRDGVEPTTAAEAFAAILDSVRRAFGAPA